LADEGSQQPCVVALVAALLKYHSGAAERQGYRADVGGAFYAE
jgi:hypothetical protein